MVENDGPGASCSLVQRENIFFVAHTYKFDPEFTNLSLKCAISLYVSQEKSKFAPLHQILDYEKNSLGAGIDVIYIGRLASTGIN